MRQVAVYTNDTPAGLLRELIPGRQYEFTYYPEYLTSGLPPVSLALPKRAEPYYAPFLFPCFQCHLPEGRRRSAVCRYDHLDEDDAFGLLLSFTDTDIIGSTNFRSLRHE